MKRPARKPAKKNATGRAKQKQSRAVSAQAANLSRVSSARDRAAAKSGTAGQGVKGKRPGSPDAVGGDPREFPDAVYQDR